MVFSESKYMKNHIETIVCERDECYNKNMTKVLKEERKYAEDEIEKTSSS